MNYLLELKNISFTVEKNKTIIHNINLAVNTQDFIVIVGHNGSGKSTLIKLVNRQYLPTTGEIYYKNLSLSSFAPADLIADFVTLNQFTRDSLFMDLTLIENAVLLESSFKKKFKKYKLVAEIRKEFYLYNPKLADALETKVGDLSGGEQQLVAFILYLRRQPQLLLLDEHTSALDPKAAENIMKITDQIIKQRKLTCIMLTHNLDHALQYGNRLVAIKDGNIYYNLDKNQKPSLNKNELIQLCY